MNFSEGRVTQVPKFHNHELRKSQTKKGKLGTRVARPSEETIAAKLPEIS